MLRPSDLIVHIVSHHPCLRAASRCIAFSVNRVLCPLLSARRSERCRLHFCIARCSNPDSRPSRVVTSRSMPPSKSVGPASAEFTDLAPKLPLRTSMCSARSAHGPSADGFREQAFLPQTKTARRKAQRRTPALDRRTLALDRRTPALDRRTPALGRRTPAKGERAASATTSRRSTGRGAQLRDEQPALSPKGPSGAIPARRPSAMSARRPPSHDLSFDGRSFNYTTAASEFLYGHSVVYAVLKARRRQLYRLYLGPRHIQLGDVSAVHRLAKEAGVETSHVPSDALALMDRASKGRPHNVRRLSCLLV